jgi:glutamate racemase
MRGRKMNIHPSVPIGVFDSGVGGLSVLRTIRKEMPGVPVIYAADQAHVPYGSRSLKEVRQFSEEMVRFLLNHGARLIVVACNTASAAALHHLRNVLPDVPFVGMEPAVKPAAESTHSQVVGVLATPATFQGELYASVVDRFAREVRILQNTCPGLVEQIEAGKLDDPATLKILHKALDPMIVAGVDTIVLGCTHYPFVIPQIQQIVGPQVQVIDPAPAVARQTRRLLAQYDWLNLHEEVPVEPVYYTSGVPDGLAATLKAWLGVDGDVHPLTWQGNKVG